MSKHPSVVIGIDPDLHKPSICVLDLETGQPVGVRCFKCAKGKIERDAVVSACLELKGAIRSMLQDLDEPTVKGAVVEGQEVAYSAKDGKNPRSLLMLAPVAGALLQECGYETDNLFFPAPGEWKGQMPKQNHQYHRVFGELGWKAQKSGKDPKTGYAFPIAPPRSCDGVEDLNKADWKHVADAIGLALWGRQIILKGDASWTSNKLKLE